MQRSSAQKLCRQVLQYQYQYQYQDQNLFKPVTSKCDAFINHRGVDTKRTIAGLLYDHLTRLHVHPFLDSKNLKPGDKLFQKIDSSIRNCKVGIALFSPRYSESYWCLHELSLLLEMNKKVIPIFWDVKPSELRVKDNGSCSAYDLQRFNWALEETKYTVGFTFDSIKGYIFLFSFLYGKILTRNDNRLYILDTNIG